uniref:Uncharacterized protein n=1 Tax=Oreochromis aureus TaxID=47969 RepID=A0A668TC82_OREAU
MRDALPKCKPEGICVRSCVCLHNVRYRMCFFRSLCVCWYAVLCVCACVCPSSLVMVQRGEVSLQLQAVMRSSTLPQDLGVLKLHTSTHTHTSNQTDKQREHAVHTVSTSNGNQLYALKCWATPLNL